MGAATMGKVLVTAVVENLEDVMAVERGDLTTDRVRAVTIADALVDTGATYLGLPRRYIDQLGLRRIRTRQARTAAGVREFGMYGTVRLVVQGREARVDVFELPDENPTLIGQVPLEILDFVVDPVGQRLIGNPAHGGEQMFEVYSFFD